MDVYAKDEDNTHYDIEIQVEKDCLGKRSRYYHSHMDMELLEKGMDYEFLQFVGTNNPSNDRYTEDLYVKQLQNTIHSIKENREMECRYNFAGDMLIREYKKGKL